MGEMKVSEIFEMSEIEFMGHESWLTINSETIILISQKWANLDIGIFKNRFLLEMTQFAKFNKYNLINQEWIN